MRPKRTREARPDPAGLGTRPDRHGVYPVTMPISWPTSGCVGKAPRAPGPRVDSAAPVTAHESAARSWRTGRDAGGQDARQDIARARRIERLDHR